MTNKQERFYVVSESELEHWADLNERLGECRTAEEVSRIKDEHIAAEAACRARPVESICAGTKDEIWVPTEGEGK